MKTNTGSDSIAVKFKAIIRIAEDKANTYPASIVNPNLYVRQPNESVMNEIDMSKITYTNMDNNKSLSKDGANVMYDGANSKDDKKDWNLGKLKITLPSKKGTKMKVNSFSISSFIDGHNGYPNTITISNDDGTWS